MVSAAALSQLKNAFRTWNSSKASNPEPYITLMSDDVAMASIAGGAQEMNFTRSHSNKDQVRAYFKELANDWEMIFFHVGTFLVFENTVAVVCECSWRHRRTGKVVHTPKLDIFRFNDEKIVGFFDFFDTHQAFAACSGSAEANAAPMPTPVYPEDGAATVEGRTAASDENIRQLKTLYEEWHDTKGGSAETILALLAPTVSWRSLSDGTAGVEFSKPNLSREQVVDYFRGLADAFEMKSYQVDEYLAAGDHVLALGRCSFTNKKTGKIFDTPKADLWRFAAGKAVEFYEYFDTAAVIATTQ